MRAVPVLVTDRLRLRPRIADDAVDLFATMRDPVVMRWWSRGPFDSVAELRAYFASDHDARSEWAITRTGDDRAIGFVNLQEKRQSGVSELGYMLARDRWGTGLAREAVAAVIDHGFATGQRRIFADTDPDNAPSNALLRRLGFVCEGRLRAEWETHIGVRDSLIWGLLAADRPPRA